jgi:hypothetical protein
VGKVGVAIHLGDLEIKNSDLVSETNNQPITASADNTTFKYKNDKLKIIVGNVTLADDIVNEFEIDMPQLLSITGDLDLLNQSSDKLKKLEMPKLKKVKNMKVKNNSKLETVDLSSLETVEEDIDIDGNKKMTEMKMPKLKMVGKNMKVKNNDELLKLELDTLDKVEDIDIDENNKLKEIKMPKLREVKTMKIKPNENLTNVDDDNKMVVEIPEETLNKNDITKDFSPNKMKFKKYKKENGITKMENGKPVMEEYTTAVKLSDGSYKHNFTVNLPWSDGNPSWEEGIVGRVETGYSGGNYFQSIRFSNFGFSFAYTYNHANKRYQDGSYYIYYYLDGSFEDESGNKGNYSEVTEPATASARGQVNVRRSGEGRRGRQ